jgi:hypothetical protein
MREQRLRERLLVHLNDLGGITNRPPFGRLY